MSYLKSLLDDPEFAEWEMGVSNHTLSGFQHLFSFSIREVSTNVFKMSIRSNAGVEVTGEIDIEKVREKLLELKFVYVHLQ